MEYKRLFIWVEGPDDVRFFERIIKPRFGDKYDFVQIIPYATMKGKKINRFISSIKGMKADYIYLADINDVPCVGAKKQQIRRNFRKVEEDRIAVVIKEIEGWYLAGLSNGDFKKFGIDLHRTTDDITKEQFNSLIPKRFDSRIHFMLEILECFSAEVAKQKNNSFRYFIQKFN